jgi:REP element-mobilizing transposase RayT
MSTVVNRNGLPLPHSRGSVKCPVAYHITFTTYGTWLHGDRRGSVNRENNQYGDSFIASAPNLCRKERDALKNPRFLLKQSQRNLVLESILQVCRFRGWLAHAVHVRSNHVHIVVSGTEKPEKMMADFKAYATKAMRQSDNNTPTFKKYWTRHGSTKYLWTKESLALAIGYVENEQGEVMAFGTTCKQSPERE